MILQKNLGIRIKELRKKKNYTQEQFAEKIDISARSLRKIEMGECFPSTATLEKIVQTLEIEIVDIFNFEHVITKENMRKRIIEIINKNPDKIAEIYRVTKAIVS